MDGLMASAATAAAAAAAAAAPPPPPPAAAAAADVTARLLPNAYPTSTAPLPSPAPAPRARLPQCSEPRLKRSLRALHDRSVVGARHGHHPAAPQQRHEVSHQPPPIRPSATPARASTPPPPALPRLPPRRLRPCPPRGQHTHPPPPVRLPVPLRTHASLFSRPRYRFFAQRGDEGAELCFSNAVLKVYGLAEPVEVGISRRFAPGTRFWEGFTVDGGSNQMDVTNEARDEEPEKPRLY